MRSSFYSYYHASCILLAALNGLVTIGFTAYLEVGWAVLLVAAVLLAWLLLFTQYTAEFTKANLMKAGRVRPPNHGPRRLRSNGRASTASWCWSWSWPWLWRWRLDSLGGS